MLVPATCFTQIFTWFIIYFQSCYVAGNSCHASCIGPLVWSSEEQGYNNSLRSTFLKGAQIHLVCPSWICHWVGCSFGSWCFDSFPSACPSLFGNFPLLLYRFVIIIVFENSVGPSEYFLVVWGCISLDEFFLPDEYKGAFHTWTSYCHLLDKEGAWRVVGWPFAESHW